MVCKHKSRAAGVRCLMSVSDFNECFYWCFGVLVSDVVSRSRFEYYQILYIYGLRKLCGLTMQQICDIIGVKYIFIVSDSLRYASCYLCGVGKDYNVQFEQDLKRLKERFIKMLRKYCFLRTPTRLLNFSISRLCFKIRLAQLQQEQLIL